MKNLKIEFIEEKEDKIRFIIDIIQILISKQIKAHGFSPSPLFLSLHR